MNNPIFNNKYIWKDIVFEIAEDYSTITIVQGDQKVIIESHALTDLNKLMDDNVFADGDKLGSKRLWNFTATSLSCPILEKEV